MPGQPFSGPLPALTEGQLQLASHLEGHVRRLAEVIGPRNFQFYPQLQATADYLQQCLESYGYRVRRQAYECDGQVFENLETESEEGPFMVVGAHYDSVYECPGANDNASGVAATLELARMLHGRGGLRFVFFCNEEPPFYRTVGMGSRQYVAQLSAGACTGMICLETVGYYSSVPGSQRSPVPGLLPDIGDFVTLVGDVQSARLVQQLVGRWQGAVAFPCLGLVPTEQTEAYLMELGMGMSDHASFWEAGIPALMVADTDTVFYRYDHYHCLSDTWEKLTYEPFARMVEGLARVLG